MRWRALAIDDDADARHIHALQLERFLKDVAVDTAGDYLTALDRLGSRHYDVIITDGNYPGAPDPQIPAGLQIIPEALRRQPEAIIEVYSSDNEVVDRAKHQYKMLAHRKADITERPDALYREIADLLPA